MVGKQLRASGGIVVQLDDNQFHINPGPGSLNMAKSCSINLRANTAILVSSSTVCNSNDLNAVIMAMTYDGFDRKGILLSSNSVINGSEGKPPALKDFYKNCVERFIVLEEGQKVAINEVEIKALRCLHHDKPVGFMFITAGCKIAYSSDTKYGIEIAEQYVGSDILILNVPLLKSEKDQKSLSKDDAISIINHAKPKLTVLTGFGLDFIKADPMYEIRDIKRMTQSQVIAATDGMVINPVSYLNG